VDTNSKLGLGTVQFGGEYGVFNARPRPQEQMVREILRYGFDAGIRVLDTASLYGNSEEVLGEALLPSHNFDFITKTKTFSEETITENHLRDIKHNFYSSLDKLKQSTITGLLAHSAKDLLKPGGKKIIELLQMFRQQGLVKKIGVSVYDSVEIDAVLDIFTPDIIQLPINLFDQKLIASGHLAKLKKHGVEIHARSLFLQGVALMEYADIPDYFLPVMDKFTSLNELVCSVKLSRLELCLLFAYQQKAIDVLLVGVTSLRDLREIVQAEKAIKDRNVDFSNLAINDPLYVNPTHWPA
jgi:aryl-alcohol dehydrogenase-like predicted oxidoreductase